MQKQELHKLAEYLNQSDQYRVIKKYQKPEFYNKENRDLKFIGVFLDIEATGLSYKDDKIIELGMVKFEYTEDGRIFRLLDEFNKYQDPHMPILPHITELTGITDDMVKNQQINEGEVADYLQNVDLIVAHNAQFDKTFFEKTFPSIPQKLWSCSMNDINWKQEGIGSRALEYIAYKYNFFYEGHRAIIDCLVGIHILAHRLPNSKELALKQLLTNSQKLIFKLWAKDAGYEHKDLLKERGYRWGSHELNNYRAWSIELTKDKVKEEINYLRSNVYSGPIDMPIEIFDAYSRFSNIDTLQSTEKYQDEIDWVKLLYKEDN